MQHVVGLSLQDVGVPALTKLLDAGYVVAATDYQGMGTPGETQYTVMGTQSRNVFDSVFAAQGLAPTKAGRDVVALGWSQGGGAALWAGETTSYGAPLRVRGIAALAPAANTGPQAAGQVAPGPVTPTSPAHAAAIRLNLYRGFAAGYPELNVSEVVSPTGMPAYAGAGRQCINHLAYVINTNVTDLEALFQGTTTPPAWQRRFDENTAGMVSTAAPVLVMQGTADTVIKPQQHGAVRPAGVRLQPAGAVDGLSGRDAPDDPVRGRAAVPVLDRRPVRGEARAVELRAGRIALCR